MSGNVGESSLKRLDCRRRVRARAGLHHDCFLVRMVRQKKVFPAPFECAKRNNDWRAQKPTVCGSDAVLAVCRDSVTASSTRSTLLCWPSHRPPGVRSLAPPSPPLCTLLLVLVLLLTMSLLELALHSLLAAVLADVDAAAADYFDKLRWRERPLYTFCPAVLAFSPPPGVRSRGSHSTLAPPSLPRPPPHCTSAASDTFVP